MNTPLYIARRYIRSKSTSNAIHLLSRLSVLGMGIGAAALILVMSVFNGFEQLVFGLTNTFNPDLVVVPAKGKTFQKDVVILDEIKSIPGVHQMSLTLEENALFAYDNVQDIGVIKGVDSSYALINQIRDRIITGQYLRRTEAGSQAVVGSGIGAKLGVNAHNEFEPLIVYMPNRSRSGPFEQAFHRRFLQPSGIFSVQPEIDMEYVLTDLEFVQSITTQRDRVSRIEIALTAETQSKNVKKAIEAIVGSDFIVKDRIGQEATFLKVMNLEKWVAFSVMCLIMILVAFNVAGTLWMVVTEKRRDIAILKTMGASGRFVRSVFLWQSAILCALAFVFGSCAALAFFILQEHYGLIPVPPGFIIDAYPMALKFIDFVIVFITVMSIGLLAAWLPAGRAARITAVIKAE